MVGIAVFYPASVGIPACARRCNTLYVCHLVLSRSGQCARFREGETSTFRGSVAHPGHTASEGGARAPVPGSVAVPSNRPVLCRPTRFCNRSPLLNQLNFQVFSFKK